MTDPRASRAGWWDTWRADVVLLDLDDVLLDTATCRRATWSWWASRVGLDADTVIAAAWGRRLSDVVDDLVPDLDTAAETAAILARERILLRTARRPRGMWSFARSLPSARWAIVTPLTNDQAAARLSMTRLPEPPMVITSEDVSFSFPDPASHLAAAERLGAAPEACVAMVGSASAVLAAKSAGMTAIGVHPHLDATTLGGADGLVAALGSVSVTLAGDGLELRARRERPFG